MATIREAAESRPYSVGETTSQELQYHIFDTGLETEAMALLLATSPTTLNSLVRKTAKVDPVWVDYDAVAGRNKGQWEGRVSYALPAKSSVAHEPGDQVINFDAGGGSVHVTQSLATVGKYGTHNAGVPNVITDFKGAIGVSKDGVDGCDIPGSSLAFTVTKYYDVGDVTATLINYLAQLEGCANNDDFTVHAITDGSEIVTMPTFGAGECRLNKVRGAPIGDESQWTIAFDFEASLTDSDVDVGGLTWYDNTGAEASIAKKGWEYLWVSYRETQQAGGKFLSKVPVEVFIERVHNEVNFDVLGIS